MSSVTPVFTQAKVSIASLPSHADIFDALQARFGLSARSSQMELSEIVRDTIHRGKGNVCCVEAPTGTGKTLGYLAGALEAQAHAAEPDPIVVATATVGLQSQIMTQDIPRLAEIGVLDPKKVVLAKGRGRYFCPHTAEMLQGKGIDTQADLFDEDKEIAPSGVPIALDMLHAWKENRWDGDKDSWEGEIPECWDSYCGASSQTCVNRACAHRERCPYMKSRAKMSKAQIIVANHDIVLADLSVRAEDGLNTVLPFKQYTLIVDEAHNFPDKAVDTQRSQANLFQIDWLRDLDAYGEAVSHIEPLAKAISSIGGISKGVFGNFAAQIAGKTEALHEQLQRNLSFDNTGVHSWGMRDRDAQLVLDAFEIETGLASVIKALKRAAVYFLEQAQDSSGSMRGRCLRRLTETNHFLKAASSLHAGLHAFRSGGKLVRWAKKIPNGGVVLNAQPLDGEYVLHDLLWRSEIPVVMVSATLQVAGSFERFSKKTGMPKCAVKRILSPVFDYSRGLLHQPAMTHEPGAAGYEAELVNKIERLFAKEVAAGTLVLFTSKDSLQRVAGQLSGAIKESLLLQGSAPMSELIKLHKQRIDAGKRSVLMGLDSMSEGLDLPGDYCNHVIITRLPFAVPSDPVEAARQEAMGGEWFGKSYLVDMLTALIQSCGRLIRRETDHGVITILDKRMYTKQYASKALDALPCFTRASRISGYSELAKARGFEVRATKMIELPANVDVAPASQQNSCVHAQSDEMASTETTCTQRVLQRQEVVAPVNDLSDKFCSNAQVKGVVVAATQGAHDSSAIKPSPPLSAEAQAMIDALLDEAFGEPEPASNQPAFDDPEEDNGIYFRDEVCGSGGGSSLRYLLDYYEEENAARYVEPDEYPREHAFQEGLAWLNTNRYPPRNIQSFAVLH